MPAPLTMNTFSALTTASTVNLDANFAALAAALASSNTFGNYLVDTGAANAYVVSLPAGVTAVLSAGLAIQFLAGNTNTGPSTLNAYATGVKNILNFDGSALAAGTIRAGAVVSVVYDGTEWKIVGQGASGPLFAYAEVPPEVINGAGAAGNHVFTALHAPNPASSLRIFHKDGQPFWPVTDYNLVGLTITFVAGNPPQAGDLLSFDYQY